MLSKTYIINQYRNLGYVTVKTDIQGVVCAYNPKLQPQKVVVICDNRANYILTKTNTDKIKTIIRESVSIPDTISDEMLFVILNNWREIALMRKNHVHVNVCSLKKYRGRISSSLRAEYYILSKILTVQKMAECKNSLRWMSTVKSYPVCATYMIFALTLVMYQYTAANTDIWGISYNTVMENGEYGRLCRYLFAHTGVLHLLGNMFFLFIIGRLLERKIGAIKFTCLYFISGIAGAIVSMAYSLDASAYTIGASGAVYGLLGALFVKVLMENRFERNLSLPTLAVIIISSLYAGIRLAGTDNFCHIGGLAAGSIAMLIIQLCDMIEVSVKSIRLQEFFNKRIVFQDGLKI